MITRGTLEEKIMGLQKFKLNIANTVVSQVQANSLSLSLSLSLSFRLVCLTFQGKFFLAINGHVAAARPVPRLRVVHGAACRRAGPDERRHNGTAGHAGGRRQYVRRLQRRRLSQEHELIL